MPAPKTIPEFVYKITDSAPPSPIPDAYPLSELDQKDGFIHLSTASQVPITAGLFFESTPALWILKIRHASIAEAGAVRWDDPPNDNDGCPHLYGNFGAADVESVERFDKGEGRGWGEVFAGSEWLV